MKQIYILLIALLMGLSANAGKSGTCGPHLKWHLTDDGVLTISRKGIMKDYTSWYVDKNFLPLHSVDKFSPVHNLSLFYTLSSSKNIS